MSNNSLQADLHWPLMISKLSVSKLMHDVYQKKLSTQGYHLWQNVFFCTWPYDLSWPWFDLAWPILDFENWKIENQLNKGMLHIKLKLKTAVLRWKSVQTSERSNDWPQADLHWPLMTSKLYVYQKKAEHFGISYVTNILLFLIIWPLMTLNWPQMTLIELQTSRIVSITFTITKKIDMLHIKQKLL